MNATHNLLSLA